VHASVEVHIGGLTHHWQANAFACMTVCTVEEITVHSVIHGVCIYGVCMCAYTVFAYTYMVCACMVFACMVFAYMVLAYIILAYPKCEVYDHRLSSSYPFQLEFAYTRYTGGPCNGSL
jgi:hypothetical protein